MWYVYVIVLVEIDKFLEDLDELGLQTHLPSTSVGVWGGGSLSEQHTDLLICHRTKQDLSCTSRYLGIT